jgi:2-(1,2-epoxy-1,2-dihydrophenyl)acetyl-CoA isomerase
MSQAFESILFAVERGVATITLNRPERLNSLTVPMHAELRAALDRVRADRSIRCVVLTGAGRGFCAGQDLSERVMTPGGPPPDLGESIEQRYKPLVLGLRELPLPVIAAVNGVAAGAGCNVALACDLVFAARSATFIQSFTKIGLMPDSGGAWTLPRLVGNARALGLTLLADKLSAEQAEAIGLIWKCVDDAQLMPTVNEVAQQLAQGPTLAYARTKAAIYASDRLTLGQAFDLERDSQRELGRSRDYREGVIAFKEKRAPRFEGQ